MTFSTRSRVSSFSSGELLMTRLTVFFDTLARRATSLIVGGLPLRFGSNLCSVSPTRSSALGIDLGNPAANGRRLRNSRAAHSHDTGFQCIWQVTPKLSEL